MPPMSSAIRSGGARRGPGQPLVTIVTVVFNGVETLAETIASVAVQAEVDYEYLILDGASSDGTIDLLAAHDAQIDRWFSRADAGIYPAMNEAVARARGRYVYFLGADDRLEPVLAAIAPALRAETAVHYGDVRLDSDGSRYFGAFDRARLCLHNICQQAIFYPRQALGCEPFNPRYRLLADHACNLALWGRGVPFRWHDLVIAAFNDRGASHRGDQAFTADRGRLIAHAFGRHWAWWFHYRMARNRWKRRLLGQL